MKPFTKRIALVMGLLFTASCFAASPVFLGATTDYMTNGGGKITFVFSNRVTVIFDRMNRNAVFYGNMQVGQDGVQTTNNNVTHRLLFGKPTNETSVASLEQQLYGYADGNYQNVVLTYGHNLDNIANVPRATFQIESRYRPSNPGPFFSEWNFDWVSPTNKSIGRRPIGAAVNQTTALTQGALSGNFGFYSSDSQTQFVDIAESGTMTLLGGTRQLVIQHASNATSSINISAAPVNTATLAFDGGYIQKTGQSADESWFALCGPPITATGAFQYRNSLAIGLGTSRWTGSAAATEYFALQAVRTADTVGAMSLHVPGGIQFDGNGLHDIGEEFYFRPKNYWGAGFVEVGKGFYSNTNSETVAAIGGNLANGDFAIVTLSNALQAVWKSNDVVLFKRLAP